MSPQQWAHLDQEILHYKTNDAHLERCSCYSPCWFLGTCELAGHGAGVITNWGDSKGAGWRLTPVGALGVAREVTEQPPVWGGWGAELIHLRGFLRREDSDDGYPQQLRAKQQVVGRVDVLW